MEDVPVACMRQSPHCCPTDSLGCLPCNFSWCRHLGRTLPAGRVSPRPACPLRARCEGQHYRMARKPARCADTQAKASSPYTAHRRIPVLKAPIAALAYHSALYRSRPEGAPRGTHHRRPGGAAQPGIDTIAKEIRPLLSFRPPGSTTRTGAGRRPSRHWTRGQQLRNIRRVSPASHLPTRQPQLSPRENRPSYRRRDGRRLKKPGQGDVAAGHREGVGGPQGHHQEVHGCRWSPRAPVPTDSSCFII